MLGRKECVDLFYSHIAGFPIEIRLVGLPAGFAAFLLLAA